MNYNSFTPDYNNHNNSMSIGKFEGNNLFSYDLSEMRDHIRNKSFLAKRK